VMDRLAEHGTSIDGDDVDKLAANLWEMKIRHGTAAHRLFFGTGPGGLIAVACGAKKKRDEFTATQKRLFEARVTAWLGEIADREGRNR
jgi:putative component of toxin-antitoxin plasmid stabilization module